MPKVKRWLDGKTQKQLREIIDTCQRCSDQCGDGSDTGQRVVDKMVDVIRMVQSRLDHFGEPELRKADAHEHIARGMALHAAHSGDYDAVADIVNTHIDERDHRTPEQWIAEGVPCDACYTGGNPNDDGYVERVAEVYINGTYMCEQCAHSQGFCTCGLRGEMGVTITIDTYPSYSQWSCKCGNEWSTEDP